MEIIVAKISFYGIIAVIGAIVRQNFLPNPFECFGDYAILINLFAEPVIHILSYTIVGLFYERGSFPIVGSLLYLIIYSSIVFLLSIFGIFSFAWWWILIILAIWVTTITFISVKIRDFLDI